MGIRVYCYSKCSTCKKALQWLDGRDIRYTLLDIKEQHPDEQTLKELWKKSGLPLKRFFNTSGTLYREMELTKKLPDMSEEEQLKLLASDGMLVKRPLLAAGDTVLTGFKEEEWEVLSTQEEAEIEPLFEEYVDFDTFSRSDLRVVKVKDCVAVPKSKKLLRFTLDDGTGTDRTILSGIHAYYEPEELIGKTLVAILNLPPRAMMGIDSCGMIISAVHKVGDEERLNLLIVDDRIPAGAKLY